MLKVGLIGVGQISTKHIAAWDALDGIRLVALCNHTPEKMQKYPEKRHYTRLEDMLEQEKLDILDICLPTDLHTETACKAMKAGVHVLCEKPVSLKQSDVALLYATAKVNHVKFMVAQVLRFWPEYRLLKTLYDSKRYGKLLSGTMSRVGPRPANRRNDWMLDKTRSGLVAYDLHIHDLDFMVHAFGAPRAAHCFRADGPDQHSFGAVYEFGDFYIQAEAAWYAAPYPFAMRFRFQFEDAVVALEGGLKIYERSGRVLDYSGQLPADAPQLPEEKAHDAQVRYFAHCVQTGQEVDLVRQEELETVLAILKEGSL